MFALVRRTFAAALIATVVPLLAVAGQSSQNAGTIIGYVLDSRTELPVADASVLLVESSLRGRTDVRGRFEYAGIPTGRYTLRIRSLGYTPMERVLEVGNGRGDVVLRIEPVVLSLSPVVVVAHPDWSPLASARVGRSALEGIGHDPELIVRYVKAMAGVAMNEDRIYVDGLPAARLPPADAIAEIAVNPDPFSVLYSETDQNVIEVISADPDRRLTSSAGYTSDADRGRNPLAPHLRTQRKFGDARLSGPVPFTPLAFFGDLARVGIDEERPVFADGVDDSLSTVIARSRARSRVVNGGIAARVVGQTRLRLTFSALDADDTGAESGGFVMPAASPRRAASSRDGRLIVETSRGRYRYSTAVSYGSRADAFVAESSGPSVVVLDALIAGSAPFRSMDVKSAEWRWHNVITPAGSSTLFGWSLARSVDRETILANRDGQMSFGTLAEHQRWLEGQPAGMHLRSDDVSQAIRSTTAALFAQSARHLTDAVHVRAGLRADWATPGGMMLSPRVSVSAARGRASAYGGVGVFRQTASDAVLLHAGRYASPADHSRRMIASGMGSDATELRSEISPGFKPLGAVVVRHGMRFDTGPLMSGVEYSWTAGFSRAGSRRVRDETALVDRLESNRRLRRRQLHARISWEFRGASTTVNYERFLSHDNSPGPFSFPERQDDLESEWARSAGFSPHNFSVVASLPRARGVQTTLMFVSRSRAPMDVRTGLDAGGAGLYNDRGGRARNDALGPRFRSLDVFAHRVVRIPFVRIGRTSPGFELALFAENVLGSRNYASVGSNMSSPLFGRPVAALPGRIVRLSIRFHSLTSFSRGK